MRISIAAAATFVLFACLSSTSTYDASQDDGAMSALTRSWAGGGASLSLCEDLAAEATAGTADAGNSCEVANVVLGGGRGSAHSISHGGGCGGCPFANEAFVTGYATIDGIPSNSQVAGSVSLGGDEGADPYGYPYYLALACTDPDHPCALDGTLQADGTLLLELAGAGSALGSATLAAGSAAECDGGSGA